MANGVFRRGRLWRPTRTQSGGLAAPPAGGLVGTTGVDVTVMVGGQGGGGVQIQVVIPDGGYFAYHLVGTSGVDVTVDTGTGGVFGGVVASALIGARSVQAGAITTFGGR